MDVNEFEIFTIDGHKTFLENYEKDTVDKKLKDRVSGIHQQYDTDLFELTGKRKTANQKTYNFLKEVISDYRDKAKGAPELQSKIDELKESIKNGAGSEQIKKDLEGVQKQFKEAELEWDTEKKDLLSSRQTMQLSNELDKSLAGITFKKSIPENVRNIMISTVRDNLVKSAQLVDGTLIFVDKDGVTLRNRENGLNPFTAEEMLRDRLKDVIGEERVIEGTGIKPEFKEDKDGKKDITILIPATVKTKNDLSVHLLEQGLVQTSKEYRAAYAKYSPDLKFSKLKSG